MVGHVYHAAKQLSRVKRTEGFLGGIREGFDSVHQEWGEQHRHDGATTKLTAEHHHRGDEQRNIEHISEITHLNRREDVVHNDAQTIHTARHNIVGVDKNSKTYRHTHAAQQDAKPRRCLNFPINHRVVTNQEYSNLLL